MNAYENLILWSYMSETDKHSRHITSLPDTAGSQDVDHGSDLRRRAEEIFRKKVAGSPANPDARVPEELRRVIEELQVHQIELEIQNQQLRQTQVELEVARSRYFDLYNLAPVGYCMLNDKGLIIEANLASAELLGVSRGELVGRPLFGFILREDQDTYYLFRRQFKESPMLPTGTTQIPSERNGEQQGCDLRMLRKDQMAFFWAHLQVNTLQDSKGEPVYRLIVSDISERKQAEALRLEIEAQNQLVQKAESLERMAAAIAHLFNNQLFIVTGNLELALHDTGPDALHKKKLTAALQAAHRSAEVSGLLLTYLGQNNLKLDTLDLSEICRRDLPEIEANIAKGITIRKNLETTGPVVRANANQIRQVLVSLITNGCEAVNARAGGGEVRVVTKTYQASDIPRYGVFSGERISGRRDIRLS